MRSLKHNFFTFYYLIFIVISIISCRDNDNNQLLIEYNPHPTLFSSIDSNENYTIFKSIIKKIEADKYFLPGTIILIPNNLAFRNYFNEKGYDSLEELNDSEVKILQTYLNLFILKNNDFWLSPNPDYDAIVQFQDIDSGIAYSLSSWGTYGIAPNSCNFSLYIEKILQNQLLINKSIESDSVILISEYRIGNDSIGWRNVSTIPIAMVFIDEIYKELTLKQWLDFFPDISEFKALLNYTGLYEYVNSECHSFLIPNNSALRVYYNSRNATQMSDIPVDTLKELVNLHCSKSLYIKDQDELWRFKSNLIYDSSAFDNRFWEYHEFQINILNEHDWRVYYLDPDSLSNSITNYSKVTRFNISSCDHNFNVIDKTLSIE